MKISQFFSLISKEKVEVCQVAVLQNLPKGEINTFAEALPHYKQLQVRWFFCVSVQVDPQIGWEDVKERLMLWIWSWRTYANLSRIFSMISWMIFHDPLHQNRLKYLAWWLNTKSDAKFAARQTDFSVCLHRFCIFKISLFLSRYIIYKPSTQNTPGVLHLFFHVCKAEQNGETHYVKSHRSEHRGKCFRQVLKLLNFQCTSEGATNFAQALFFFHEYFCSKNMLHNFFGCFFQRLIHQIPHQNTQNLL